MPGAISQMLVGPSAADATRNGAPQLALMAGRVANQTAEVEEVPPATVVVRDATAPPTPTPTTFWEDVEGGGDDPLVVALSAIVGETFFEAATEPMAVTRHNLEVLQRQEASALVGPSGAVEMIPTWDYENNVWIRREAPAAAPQDAERRERGIWRNAYQRAAGLAYQAVHEVAARSRSQFTEAVGNLQHQHQVEV